MKYNFDEIIDRHGTDCLKYDFGMKRKGRDDLLPMWVADMDFRLPDEIRHPLPLPALPLPPHWPSPRCCPCRSRIQLLADVNSAGIVNSPSSIILHVIETCSIRLFITTKLTSI